MPNFTVGVNIGARLNRSYQAAFQRARQTANFAGRAIERSGRNAAAGFAGPRGLGPALGGALGGAATAAFLRRSVDTAIQLERAEKAFRKVSGNLTRQQQGSFIRQLNTFATSGRTLSTVEELRRSAATIAQSGVDRGGTDLLGRWVRFAEQASVAFDIPLGEATQKIIELTNALAGDRTLEEQYGEASRLSDIITHLGNNTASSEKKILPFLHRVAGTAGTFGISAENAAAFGAAITGAGTPTEKAGTAFNAMLLILSDMNGASKRAKDGLSRLGLSVGGLAQSWTRNADKTFFDFLRTLHEAGAERGAIAKAIFGTEHADEVLKLTSKAWAKYTEAIDLANDKSAVAGARQREAAEALKGMEKDVTQAKNAWALFNEELGKTVFTVAKPYLQAATPLLQQGAEAVQKNPAVGHVIAGGLGLVGGAILDRLLLGGAVGRLIGRGAGAAIGAATRPLATRAAQRTAQELSSKAASARIANMMKQSALTEAKWKVDALRQLYDRTLKAAGGKKPTGAVAGELAKIKRALAGAKDELKGVAAAAKTTAKQYSAAQAAATTAANATKGVTKTGASWLRRLLIGGGTALAGGAILDVLLNPAEAADTTLSEAERAQQSAQRAAELRGRRGFFGPARFERPGNRPNYLTQRSLVEIFDLPGDRATAAPAITARPAAHSLVDHPAVDPIASLAPRDPRYGQTRIAEAMANRWFRGVGDEPIRLKPLVVTGKTSGSGSGIFDPDQPWYGRDWFGGHPDDAAESRRNPWDFGQRTPDAIPAPDSAPRPAPDIFDDAGGMARGPVAIDDKAILAELKRSNALQQQLVALLSSRRVSGTPFYDSPSYVNT